MKKWVLKSIANKPVLRAGGITRLLARGSGVMAGLLLLGMAAGCAGLNADAGSSTLDHMAAAQPVRDRAPDPSFTDAEYTKLRSLQLDGYEDMSVAGFREKVWALTDTPEYHSLLERFSQSELLYACKDSDPMASFFFYILMPLTAGDQRAGAFGDVVSAGEPAGDQAVLEFFFTFTVLDADRLTVGEYRKAQIGMTDGFRGMLQGAADAKLRDEPYMYGEIDRKARQLVQQWSSTKLAIETEFHYMPMQQPDNAAQDVQDRVWQEGQQNKEEWEFPNGTKKDYDSLLALKTKNYKKLPLAEFNRVLLEWANEDYERMERINGDIGRDDFCVPLTDEERAFVCLTVQFSGIENAKLVQSTYTGRAEEDPFYNQYLPQKTGNGNGQSAFCDLFYQFSYHIADKKAITVEERDQCIGGVLSGIRQYWEAAKLEDLLKMGKADIAAKLQEIADTYSSRQLVVTIPDDGITFERMDERVSDSLPDEEHASTENRETMGQNTDIRFSDAYRRLAALKTKGYGQKSIAAFHKLLAPDADTFDKMLADYAKVMEQASEDDKNDTFFAVTLRASFSELYGEVFKEPPYYGLTLEKKGRQDGVDSDGEPCYAFSFYAGADISYQILKPQTLTVAQRDRILTVFCRKLQKEVDRMSETEAADGNIRDVLESKAAAIAKQLSSDKMELFCEIGYIDLFDGAWSI